MPVEHYENFPVASFLLPRKLRRPVEIIYAFARSADDIADEGTAASTERQVALHYYQDQLDRIEKGKTPEGPLFMELARVIHDYRLPIQAFRDLLAAFTQDIVKTRYANFDELLAYCRLSANPVGLLMLHLYQAYTPQNHIDSDAICSSLQLINFWQDVGIDWQKQRIYLPQTDLRQFNVTEQTIDQAQNNSSWQALMRFEIERTRALMLKGAPLALRLSGRIGWELRLIVQGGLRILERIEAVNCDVFHQRPTLNRWDWLRMASRTLRSTARGKIT